MKRAFQIFGVALGYFLLALLGLRLATVGGFASNVWPATGVALAGVLLFGRSMWLGVFIGAFAANAVHGLPLAAAATIGLGSSLEALAGGWIFKKLSAVSTQLEHQSRTVGLVVGSILGAAIAATFGALSLTSVGVVARGSFWGAWFTWWSGDALGAVLVTPFLLALSKQRIEWRKASILRVIELVLFVLLCAVIVRVVFSAKVGASFLLFFPFALLCAARYGALGVSAVAVALSAVSIAATTRGEGPFVGRTLDESLTHLQLFIASLALTAKMLNGLRAAGALRSSAIVLIPCWFLTGALSYSFYWDEQDRDQHHFQRLIREAEQAIRIRIHTYEDALLGGVGLFATNGLVPLDDFRTYVETVKVGERYPGIRGIGMIWPVPVGGEKEYIEKFKDLGVKGLTIKSVPDAKPPPGADKLRYVISYIEPLGPNAPARGLDVGSETNRRTAADLARDTGRPAMTRKIILVQDDRKRPGFLLYYPMYTRGAPLDSVEARREAFVGWMYAPFVTETWLTTPSSLRTRAES